jgi:hypothetical protein
MFQRYVSAKPPDLVCPLCHFYFRLHFCVTELNAGHFIYEHLNSLFLIQSDNERESDEENASVERLRASDWTLSSASLRSFGSPNVQNTVVRIAYSSVIS